MQYHQLCSTLVMHSVVCEGGGVRRTDTFINPPPFLRIILTVDSCIIIANHDTFLYLSTAGQAVPLHLL